MTAMNRRNFLKTAGVGLLGVSAGIADTASSIQSGKYKFSMNLNVSQFGIKADPFEAIRLAKQYGYDSINPMTDVILKYSKPQRDKIAGEMKAAGLKWGPWVVRPFFNIDPRRFAQRLEEVRETAPVLERLGVRRCVTWTMPSSDTFTYRDNFRLHVERSRQMCKLLADYDQRLGIEYIGTKTLVLRWKFPFVRTLREMKELTDEVALQNVGLVLDSWHWYQAGDTEADILTLKNSDVVSVDICDAPAGVAREQMTDSPRKLPCTTGVIDVKSFLSGLVKIGYQGPVGTEPFDNSLSQMSTARAMTTATNAMKKAFALIP